MARVLPEFLSSFRLDEKNLSTYYEPFEREEGSHFIKQVVSSMHCWGQPQMCPHNDHTHIMTYANLATVTSTTTYGGPGSKYRTINEDSFFFGINVNKSLIVGVVDGAGGSCFGYLAGKLANEALATKLYEGKNVIAAFAAADEHVILNGKGGYATGVAVEIDENRFVQIAAKGDTRAMTVRDGALVREGTTIIQSDVAKKIEQGILPPHAIHTAKGRNIIYSIIGNHNMPLTSSAFQAESGDQLVLASDGLWDVISDFEITQMAKKYCGHEL
jgi:serine/threonine protein phosphatase PrpC